jgi:hypothetical protein
MNNITFSPEFINEFDGTHQELSLLIANIKSLMANDNMNNSATSMTFNTGGFDQIVEITI